MTELKLVGGYGSPYSRKMRAVLRYRRIPFRWVARGSAEDREIPQVPVALIPVLVFPGEGDAPDEGMIDSTPQIRRLEAIFAERSIIPPDPALAFLDALVEDYADEWVTKAMFHYRWSYAPDIEKASRVLILDRDTGLAPELLEQRRKFIADRQIGRLGVVGSNPLTKPVVESSYRRLLGILDHILEERPFVLGERPGSADFALFGQLSQLVHFDPTPRELAEREAPRVVAWTTRVDDLSWLDPAPYGWLAPRAAAAELRPLLEEIGRVYAPFLIANADALERGAEQVECEIDGRKWVQRPFPYQGKCLGALRRSYRELAAPARELVAGALAGTGCEILFA